MNWIKFFQDNSQSLFTLAAVFLGSLITYLISYLNNRFESKERDKDRNEARRESKIELALALKRSDVKTLEDSINNALNALDIAKGIKARRLLSGTAKQEMLAEITAALIGQNNDGVKLGELDTISDMLASTLGNEFVSVFGEFEELWADYFDSLANDVSVFEDEGLYRRLVTHAGKLHTMLMEQLISVRDGIPE